MKKLILSLALAAFIGGGTLATAMTNTDSNSETIEMIQDGKKKASSTKKATETKKEECKDTKKSDCKTKCDDKKATKKSCCSDGKTPAGSKAKPEKK